MSWPVPEERPPAILGKLAKLARQPKKRKEGEKKKTEFFFFFRNHVIVRYILFLKLRRKLRVEQTHSTTEIAQWLGKMDTDNAASDDTPLLGSKPAQAAATTRYVVAVSFALVVLADFASYLMDAPQTSILETIICDRHYASVSSNSRQNGNDTRDCTVAPVQAELAMIVQLSNTFNLVPGLIVSIPFGVMADHYGRRPVLFLATFGFFIQDIMAKIVLWRPDVFPPRLIWATSVARFIGGGDAVASSMIFLVVADVAPAHQRANLFFLLSACILVGDIVATPLSAFLMSRDPWIPYLGSSVLSLVGSVIPLVLLPETLVKPQLGLDTSAAESSTAEERPVAAEHTHSSSKLTTVMSNLRPLLRRNIISVLLAFFVAALGRQSTSFLLQYLRQRFQLTYEKVRLHAESYNSSINIFLTRSQASLFIALRGLVNLALLLVGLPLLNKVLDRRAMSVQSKDLLISRVSVALFAIGSLVISASPVVTLAALGIMVFALGSGFAPAVRSLMSSLCHQDEAGLIYSALAFMQSCGGLVAGPLLAMSFRWALSLGREWTGIPFALISALFCFGLIAISWVRL